MSYQINGTNILKQVKSRIEVHRNNLKDRLSNMKMVIFQFDPQPDLTDPYEIGKHKAADTSTAQKCKLFGDFLGCDVEVVKLPHDTQFEDFREIISIRNQNENVKGIIIQHPIPKMLEPLNNKSKQISQLISMSKDLDAMSDPGIERWGRCATADAICRVVDMGLKRDSKVVLVGSIGFVGGGVDSYLKARRKDLKIELQTVNEKPKDSTTSLEEIKDIKPSILISTTGQAQLIKFEFLTDTNLDLLVDCGFIITDWKNAKDIEGKHIVVGDIDRGYRNTETVDENGNKIYRQDESQDAYNSAEFVTPVPGGTGPMEMAVLLERFMMKEFPQLKLEPWKLIKLEKLTAELANRSPDDKTPIDYLVDPEVEFRESINATVIHRSKPPDAPGLGRSL
jgi:methylenetetrahydrofolate dehydrogenase (NADP+) / methenyltetrahydrofolate cyclohydrolase